MSDYYAVIGIEEKIIENISRMVKRLVHATLTPEEKAELRSLLEAEEKRLAGFRKIGRNMHKSLSLPLVPLEEQTTPNKRKSADE